MTSPKSQRDFEDLGIRFSWKLGEISVRSEAKMPENEFRRILAAMREERARRKTIFLSRLPPEHERWQYVTLHDDWKFASKRGQCDRCGESLSFFHRVNGVEIRVDGTISGDCFLCAAAWIEIRAEKPIVLPPVEQVEIVRTAYVPPPKAPWENT